MGGRVFRKLSYINGGIYKPDFSEKFSQKFFTNISFTGLSPPFYLTKCHIWGGYGRGPPVIMTEPPGGGTI